MYTVYYLTHLHTDRRLRWYSTLAGARIAQRSRNHRLGFTVRLERVQLGSCEYERCQLATGVIVDATWYIEEAVIDTLDLVTE